MDHHLATLLMPLVGHLPAKVSSRLALRAGPAAWKVTAAQSLLRALRGSGLSPLELASHNPLADSLVTGLEDLAGASKEILLLALESLTLGSTLPMPSGLETVQTCPTQVYVMLFAIPDFRVSHGHLQHALKCQVYVPPHPLVKHWLAVARNAATPSPIFRSALAELGRILIYEAVREMLPTVDGVIDTPMGPAEVTCVDPSRPVKVVPILRAGLVLLEQAVTLLPASETYHVGFVRNEETLQASCYLNKLPERIASDDLVLVTDPMLATGGTMMQVLQDIVARGADPANIRVIAIVAAPPALKLMADAYPGLKVYTAIIDSEVSSKGYIIPGLGDAGDRAFGSA
eukprot:gene4850-5097_t